MKTLRELEVEAYLAGALVMADLYARNEDGSILELKIEQLEEQKLELQDEVDEFRRIAEDYEEYLTESEAKVHKLNGRIEVLEHAAWRLEQLEK
jgi:predicted RNase H-like nuclease (RuvC/YqgF family)